MKTVQMSIVRTEVDAAPVGTMIAMRSIVGVIERKNETEMATVTETIDVVEEAVEEVVRNHDHGLILHRRRMVAVVVLMDVTTVAKLLTAVEIIITAQVRAVMQAITETATETPISGTIVIIVTTVITVIIGTVTAIVMAEGVAMVLQDHLVISATEVVVEADDTMIVDLVALAPAIDRLSM